MDKIKVKYHNPICTIEKIRVGDWIDSSYSNVSRETSKKSGFTPTLKIYL